jgi:hypothetical protein
MHKSLNICHSKKCSKQVAEESETHILYPVLFAVSLAVFEITKKKGTEHARII